MWPQFYVHDIMGFLIRTCCFYDFFTSFLCCLWSLFEINLIVIYQINVSSPYPYNFFCLSMSYLRNFRSFRDWHISEFIVCLCYCALRIADCIPLSTSPCCTAYSQFLSENRGPEKYYRISPFSMCFMEGSGVLIAVFTM